jgi:Fe-S-cluster-containing dehydrogenase component
MKRYHLIVDVEKCENCNNCFLACKDEHVGNDWPGYTGPQANEGPGWIRVEGKERGRYPLIDVAYLPVFCMHCDDAPCIAAGHGAVTKRLDGIVLIDPEKAKGNRGLAASCPYGSIRWNDELETPQKCTLCAHLLDDGWQKTRCVQSCPTGALTLINIHDYDMEKMIEQEHLEAYRPKAGAKPMVFYKNLHRFTTCFIAGGVATAASGREECAEGAVITLFDRADQLVATTKSDAFGDFKFDSLLPDSGKYTLKITYQNREATLAAEVTESVNAGVIRV